MSSWDLFEYMRNFGLFFTCDEKINHLKKIFETFYEVLFVKLSENFLSQCKKVARRNAINVTNFVFANNSYFTLSFSQLSSLKTFHLFYEKLFFSKVNATWAIFLVCFLKGKKKKKKKRTRENLTLRCCSWRYSFIMRVLSTPDEQQKEMEKDFPSARYLIPINFLLVLFTMCLLSLCDEYEK